MITLDFIKQDAKRREEVVEQYYKELIRDRSKSKLAALEQWCATYLTGINEKDYDFKSVVTASPEQLMAIKAHLDARGDLEVIKDELKGTNSFYIIGTLYEQMHKEAKTTLLKNLNVSVCPYCNRNYVYSDEEVISCQLDHFFPKEKYPILAVSFYNLIPVCPVCNLKKHSNDFEIYPHDQSVRTDDLLQFTYKILGSDFLKNKEDLSVELKPKDARYKRQADILKLKELYRHHNDVVQDILRKRQVFSDAYLDNLYAEFSGIFHSRTELEELVYGTPLKPEEYGKRPLAKMTHDIYEEAK